MMRDSDTGPIHRHVKHTEGVVGGGESSGVPVGADGMKWRSKQRRGGGDEWEKRRRGWSMDEKGVQEVERW